LVEVDGQLMIQACIKNLNINAQLIFVVSKKCFDRYQLKYLLETLSEDVVKIVVADTDANPNIGQCCQILLCKDYLDLEKPVLVAQCTQLLEWDSNTFLYSLANPAVDGGVLTFLNSHPRYSYVNMNENGWIVEADMKKPISTNALAGVFYWKRGFDLIKYSALVVAKGKDSLEKYASILAIDECIRDGLRFKSIKCRRMWEWSNPNDLDYYLMVHTDSNKL